MRPLGFFTLLGVLFPNVLTAQLILPKTHTYTNDNNECVIEWHGEPGHHYLIASSSNLQSWSFIPTISTGSDSTLNYRFNTEDAKRFYRIHVTYDNSLSTLAGVINADFDSDGLTNGQELGIDQNGNHTGQSTGTDPNNQDSDGDGETDGAENLNGTDPNDPNEIPPAEPLFKIYERFKRYDSLGYIQVQYNAADLAAIQSTLPGVYNASNGGQISPFSGSTLTFDDYISTPKSSWIEAFGLLDVSSIGCITQALGDYKIVNVGRIVNYEHTQYFLKISYVYDGNLEVSEGATTYEVVEIKIPPNEVETPEEDTLEIEANNPQEINLQPFEFKDITFDGDNLGQGQFTPMFNDKLDVAYSKPQWRDVDGNGNPTDTANGERNYPIAFSKGRKPKIGATIKCVGLPQNTVFKLSASGTDGISIPETQVNYIQNNLLFLPATESTTKWQDHVKLYDLKNNAFELTWKLKIGNNAPVVIGKTKHQVYITHADNLDPGISQESFYYLGCKNASGKTEVADIVGSIWADFTDRNVTRVNGDQIKYYNPANGNTANPFIMLQQDANKLTGTCVAWARILHLTLQAQGIPGSSEQSVRSKYNDQFLIKNWTFTGNGNPSSLYPDFDYKANKVAPGNRIAAQGNLASPNQFVNHCLVKYNGKYYDPSYGVPLAGAGLTLNEWENSAVDGYLKLFNGISRFKKNEPQVQEIVEN